MFRDAKDKNKVRNAYKKLMFANHPDKGGSRFIALKLSEAKDLLLKAIEKEGKTQSTTSTSSSSSSTSTNKVDLILIFSLLFTFTQTQNFFLFVCFRQRIRMNKREFLFVVVIVLYVGKFTTSSKKGCPL
jgi:hypothetical protein